MVPSHASDQESSMLQALEATTIAIRHYANACDAMRQQPHLALASRMLDLNVRRLQAMEADLRRRTRRGATADALYVSLTVAHAGLLSLADAAGRVCDAYRQTLAIDPPAEGWFLDDSVEATALRQPEPTTEQSEEA